MIPRRSRNSHSALILSKDSLFTYTHGRRHRLFLTITGYGTIEALELGVVDILQERHDGNNCY